jgi:aspartate/methionine/tyrosine aminotransferase
MGETRAQGLSRYQTWAKLRSEARFNLAVSGIPDYPLADLPLSLNELEIGGTGPYGYPPLMQRLAAKAGVPQECLVNTVGTSMANFVALTALVGPGDEVLVERPTYDPLLAILDHLGAKVSHFERRADRAFRLGLGELERRITPKIQLVVLCNLHNPSSAFTDDDTLKKVGEMAGAVGARVLVDEVYLETLFDHFWRSAFHLGTNFVTTSSLSKAYGLSGLRCGWILAQPELVQRMWQVVDFTYGSPAHPAECIAVLALDHLNRVRDRARGLLETNRGLVNAFLSAHPQLDCPPSQFGTTVFPRLKNGVAAEFVASLRERFQVSVVPGEFFEHPQHFRLGFSVATEIVRGGLEQLSTALDEWKSH